jgi:hypothetical protein
MDTLSKTVIDWRSRRMKRTVHVSTIERLQLRGRIGGLATSSGNGSVYMQSLTAVESVTAGIPEVECFLSAERG